MGEISQFTLYVYKGSPICSLLVGTLSPIEYSPSVLIHFAFSLPLITYKIRWELCTPVNPLEERTHQQRKHQQVKPKYNKRTQTQGEERATLEHPDKEIKETTSLNPIELLQWNFALKRELAKWNIRNCRNKQKESPKKGRPRQNLNQKEWKTPH